MTGLLLSDTTVISVSLVQLSLEGFSGEFSPNGRLLGEHLWLRLMIHMSSTWWILPKHIKNKLSLLFLHLFLPPYSYTLRLHMLFSMNVRCCVYLCDFSHLVHASRNHGYHSESDQIRFWPPNDPPHSRSRHQICVLVHFVHQCVPPLACFVRTAAK